MPWKSTLGHGSDYATRPNQILNKGEASSDKSASVDTSYVILTINAGRFDSVFGRSGASPHQIRPTNHKSLITNHFSARRTFSFFSSRSSFKRRISEANCFWSCSTWSNFPLACS